MSLLSLLVATSFGIAGALFCAIIIRILYEALIGPQKGWSESWKIKQRERLLSQIEKSLDQADLPNSFKLLRQTLYFDHLKYNPELIERISSLNFSVLAKIFDLSKTKDINASEIEILEGLFSSRTSLLRSCGEVLISRNSLLRKRNNDMPAWAFDEYQRKLTEFSEQLDTNRKSIELQLDRIFVSIEKNPASKEEEIVYH